MLGTLLFSALAIGLLIGGFKMFLDVNLWIDNLTEKIKTDWLRITIRIVMKVLSIAVILFGIACTVICISALQEPKKGKK